MIREAPKTIPAWTIVLLRQDKVHYGGAYTEPNLHFHRYIDVEFFKMVENEAVRVFARAEKEGGLSTPCRVAERMFIRSSMSNLRNYKPKVEGEESC